jgi:predicted nucleic acid-binding protein
MRPADADLLEEGQGQGRGRGRERWRRCFATLITPRLKIESCRYVALRSGLRQSGMRPADADLLEEGQGQGQAQRQQQISPLRDRAAREHAGRNDAERQNRIQRRGRRQRQRQGRWQGQGRERWRRCFATLITPRLRIESGRYVALRSGLRQSGMRPADADLLEEEQGQRQEQRQGQERWRRCFATLITPRLKIESCRYVALRSGLRQSGMRPADADLLEEGQRAGGTAGFSAA